jgi:hypothetical protein
MSVLAWVLARWRVVLLVLAVAVLAFLLGRGCAPAPKYVERVRVETVEVERVRNVEVKVREEAEARTVVVYRDRWRMPDGTEREQSVERTDSGRHTVEGGVVIADVERSRTAEVEQHREVLATPPQWRAGVLAGLDPTRPLELDRLALGAHVERRIAGPVFLGAWVLPTTPAAGLSLTVEF